MLPSEVYIKPAVKHMKLRKNRTYFLKKLITIVFNSKKEEEISPSCSGDNPGRNPAQDSTRDFEGSC